MLILKTVSYRLVLFLEFSAFSWFFIWKELIIFLSLHQKQETKTITL